MGISKYVDEEIWLEREEETRNNHFTFYRNGEVTFMNIERKREKEVREILEKNGSIHCGTRYIHYINSQIYKTVVRKGKWIVEDNIIKINYFKGEEIQSKKYLIKYLKENAFDIIEIRNVN